MFESEKDFLSSLQNVKISRPDWKSGRYSLLEACKLKLKWLHILLIHCFYYNVYINFLHQLESAFLLLHCLKAEAYWNVHDYFISSTYITIHETDAGTFKKKPNELAPTNSSVKKSREIGKKSHRIIFHLRIIWTAHTSLSWRVDESFLYPSWLWCCICQLLRAYSFLILFVHRKLEENFLSFFSLFSRHLSCFWWFFPSSILHEL